MESIGGQAVIEGVMLRSKYKYVVAARDSSGKIHSQVTKISDQRIGFFSCFKLWATAKSGLTDPTVPPPEKIILFS